MALRRFYLYITTQSKVLRLCNKKTLINQRAYHKENREIQEVTFRYLLASHDAGQRVRVELVTKQPH